MPVPWPIEIRQRSPKALFVFPTKRLKTDAIWGHGLFLTILDEFNKLNLGVSMRESNEAPDPNGGGGADVQIDLSDGTHRFNFLKQNTGSLLPPPSINGKTHPAIQGGEIIRAFIFLPANPLVAGSGSRGVGKGVKIAIALHELLHACGLRSDDPGHDPNGTPDLFMSGASLSGSFPPDGVPGDPTKPGDRLDLGSGKFHPPFFVTPRTAGMIKNNWR